MNFQTMLDLQTRVLIINNQDALRASRVFPPPQHTPKITRAVKYE